MHILLFMQCIHMHFAQTIKCALTLLPSPQLSERRYCDARRHAVTLCVSAALGGQGNTLYPVVSSYN